MKFENPSGMGRCEGLGEEFLCYTKQSGRIIWGFITEPILRELGTLPGLVERCALYCFHIFVRQLMPLYTPFQLRVASTM